MSYITFREEANLNTNHLDHRYASHFSGDGIIDKLSMEICKADFISKKEFAESIEVVRQIQRIIKSNQSLQIYDICGGHGFVGILLALFGKGIKKANIVDLKKPVSHEKLISCAEKVSITITEKVNYLQEDYETLLYEPNSLILGIHACGERTDKLMKIAFKNNSGVVLLPCCYTKKSLPGEFVKYSDTYVLKDLIDIFRLTKAHNNGYKTSLKTIPEKITPMNKLFFFLPENFYNF